MKIELLPEKMKIPLELLQKKWRTAFGVFSIFFIFSCIPTYLIAGDGKLLEKEKTSLINALQHLSKDYQVFFSYDQEVVQGVEVNFEPEEYTGVTHALDEMLDGTSLKYKMFNNRYIILYEQSPEALSSLKGMVEHLETVINIEEKEAIIKNKFSPINFLPSRDNQFSIKPMVFSISGTVVDESGEPLIGVNIQVKGSNKGTATDFEGNFVLDDVEEDEILVVSYIGYQTQEVPIGENSNIRIIMVSDSQMLDEVLVVGYSTQTKKEVTGSISTISTDNIKDMPAGNTEQLLQGQASGLNIITSGSPGSPSNIRIRGITSFGDNNPLVIIDGVEGELADINANDIASISVLKDAGASAIYGVRGSNGVIIITTKKGNSEKPRVNYSSKIGVQLPLQGNVYNLLNTQEMADATWQAYRNSGQVSSNGNPSHSQYGNGQNPVIPDYIMVGRESGVVGGISTEQFENYNVDFDKGEIYQIVEANKEGTDWFHELFSPAFSHDHNLSISSRSNQSSYYISGSYLDQQGTMLGSYHKRYGVRANTSFHITDNITIGENLYFYHTDRPSRFSGVQGVSDTGNPLTLSYLMQPIIPVFDIMGNYAGTAASSLGQSPNPYATAVENGSYENKNYGVQGNVFGEITFLKNLKLRSSFGGIISTSNSSNFRRRTYENAENSLTSVYSESSFLRRRLTFTNTLEYKKRFFDKHNLKTLLGLEAVQFMSYSLDGSAADYFTNDIDFLTLSSGSGNFTNSSSRNENTLYSNFAKIDYNYLEKYILEITLRRDGSSRFGENRKWGTFPAFSAGWRISEEVFLNNNNWLSNAMIRASWGIMGNQLNIASGNAFTQFSSALGNSYYDINGSGSNPEFGLYISKLGNTFTSWEEDRLLNVGIDLSFLNGRIDFSIEGYKKDIKGLLFSDQAPAIVGGASLPEINLGDIQNKGVDVSLGYRLNVNDFTLGLNGNITAYKSKIVEIPNDYFDDGSSRVGNFVRNMTGHPVGAFFGYEVDRLFSSVSDVESSPKQDGAAPGRFKFRDINEDGEITADDRTFIGDPNPDFSYGLNINLGYKNLSLSMFFWGSQGNDVARYQRWWTDFYSSFEGVKSKDLLYNSWTPDNLDAKTPILENASNFSTNSVVNSYYIEDGSFLKLKNLTVSYDFSSISKIFYNRNFRVYLQAVNLFTLTNYSGLDPEIGGSSSAFGIDYGNYPNNQKSFHFGINLEF